jgi:hypothetical protein
VGAISSWVSLIGIREGEGEKDEQEDHDLPGNLPAGKQPQTPKSMSLMKSLKPEARGGALINTLGVTQESRFEPRFFDPARAVMEGVCLKKLGFNWVVLMQARCLFLISSNGIETSASHQWCASSVRRRMQKAAGSATPSQIPRVLYGCQKRGRAEAALLRQKRTQREVFGEDWGNGWLLSERHADNE